MKILLFNPPRSPINSILDYAPEEAKHFIHKKLIGPPLGLLTIAASVQDFDVMLIDLKGEYDLFPHSPELSVLVRKYLDEEKPDIVGTTFIASEFYYGIEILSEAKRYNPSILTVAGGLHTSLCLEDFNNSAVDIVCQGQSAGLFREVVIAREKGTGFDHIGGIHIRRNNRLEKTRPPAPAWNASRENFIMPDRHQLKRWIDTYKVGGSPHPSTYVFTSLGCPYRCTFCSIWPQHNGRFQQREVESLITELKNIDDYPVVRFADANTIVDIDFINQLFDRINEEGIRKTFIMDIRTDTAAKNPKLIGKLAKAGLKVVICGFESYKEEELKKYNKDTSAENIKKAIDVFHQNGIMIRGNYVIPNDYTEDDFDALSEYAATNKVVYAGYTILSPMPGTVFYQEVKDQIIDFDLRKYNFFNSVLKTRMPAEKFYESVGRLWLIKEGKDVI